MDSANPAFCMDQTYLDYKPFLNRFSDDLQKQNYAYTTVKGYFTAVNGFFDYLMDEGIVSVNPVPQYRRRYVRQFKESRPESRQIITNKQFEGLVNSAAEPYKSIILIMGLCGLRREEVTSLNVGDFDFQKHIINVHPHPKRTNTVVLMPPIVETKVKEYFKKRTNGHKKCPGQNSPAFVGIQNKNRILGERIRLNLQATAEKLGFHNPDGKEYEKFYPHCLRHYFTALLMESGLSIEYVKELRGDLRADLYGYYHIPIEKLYREYVECIPEFEIK